MGPITLVDKSAIQALGFEEVKYLDRYYSLVLSPILMRELLSTLAKEPKKGKDWEKTLGILAAKVDTMNSYLTPTANQMARSSLLGNDLPMDGRVPLAEAKRMRYRDGTQGIFVDEPKGKKILRDWKQQNFTDYYRDDAARIREVDHGIDLGALQKFYADQLKNFPDFKTLKELLAWLDDVYFKSMTPEFHLKQMAVGLLIDAEFSDALRKFQEKKSSIQEFAPYAFFHYRVNTLFLVGLAKGLISTSKAANLHLDVQYLYYLPFCMCFLTSDKKLMAIAELLTREDQTLLSGEALKEDLVKISAHFEAMTPEGLAKYREDFGSYPPELPNSLTEVTWKQRMRPRPPKGQHSIKLSKEEEKALLEKFRKMSNDSVPVDEEDFGNAKAVRPKLSIHQRNNNFFRGVFGMLGMLKAGEWSDVKKSFSAEHVKKIYDLHADLWHPNDNFKEMAQELASEKKLRVIYIGDVEQYDVMDQIWRMCLHFDQILIPDPFQSAWSRKEEFNQIAKPDQYLDDTLMLVYSMAMLQPLIETGQVLFVPDPADFLPSLKMKMVDVCERKKKLPFYSQGDYDAEGRVEKKGKQIFVRTLAQLPVEMQRQHLQAQMPADKVEDILKYLKLVRTMDVGCVDRDVTAGQLIQIRSGANFESSLLMAAFYDATPLSAFPFRTKEYQRYAETPSETVAKLAENFKSTPNCRVDPYMAAFAFTKGAFSEFRAGVLKILGNEKLTLEAVAELFAYLEEETRIMAEISVSKTGADAEHLLEKLELTLLVCDAGFSDEFSREYISAYDEELLKRLPRYFIGSQPSNVPDDLIEL
jgi:hypothetical protein